MASQSHSDEADRAEETASELRDELDDVSDVMPYPNTAIIEVILPHKDRRTGSCRMFCGFQVPEGFEIHAISIHPDIGDDGQTCIDLKRVEGDG